MNPSLFVSLYCLNCKLPDSQSATLYNIELHLKIHGEFGTKKTMEFKDDIKAMFKCIYGVTKQIVLLLTC